MKTKAFTSGIALVLIMLATSCSRSNVGNPSNSSNSWTINGVTYNTDSCILGSNNSVIAYSPFTGPAGTTRSLHVNLYGANVGGTYHPNITSGVFTVVSDIGYNPTTNQVALLVVADSTTYTPVGGGSGTQTLQISQTSTGKWNVTASAIKMVALNNIHDSTTLTFNITQTP
jgi:hypothetical protein